MKHSYGHETDEGCKYFSNGNNNVNVCIYNAGHIKTCDYLKIQFKFEQNVFMFYSSQHCKTNAALGE